MASYSAASQPPGVRFLPVGREHRRGMVYMENDDSSSGEGFPEADHHQQQQQQHFAGRPYAEQGSSRSSSRGGESEASYEEVYSSSEDSYSYHSDCDDIAEYWDPYCELLTCL